MAAAQKWRPRRARKAKPSTASARHNPPSWLISRVPVACSTEPAPKNNKRFEQTVIPHVEKSTGQCQPAPGALSSTHCDQRKSKTDKNDADVLDAMIGKQSFEVMLAERKGHPEHSADYAQVLPPPTPLLGRHRKPASEANQTRRCPILMVTPERMAET